MSAPGERDRSPILIALAIICFPLLRPHGPAHVTPDDILVGAAIFGVIVWAGRRGLDLHVPYVVPFAVFVVTGLIAAMFSVVEASSIVAVGQDLFLLAWAAALANAIRVPRNLGIILASWAWGATAWASALILAVLAHQSWLSGGPSGGRAQLWFDNPNMAGNYFVISIFVVMLGRYPRGRAARTYAYLALFGAIVLTGSNAALVSLTVGVAATALFAIRRRTDLLTAVGTGVLASVVLAVIAFAAIETGVVGGVLGSSNTLVVHSIDRFSKSSAGRSSLFGEEFSLYQTGSLLGRGPASTKTNLELRYGDIVKEAHDDYLATLVERGPIGEIGLLILLASITVRVISAGLRPLLPTFQRLLSSPPALIGCVVSMGVTATTHEILHYRHVWAFLGILAGIYLFGRVRTSSPSVAEGSFAP